MGLITINGKPVKLGGEMLNVSAPDPEIYLSTYSVVNIPYTGNTCAIYVCGNSFNSTTVADACNWLVTTSPVMPSVSPGTINNVQICMNTGSTCRCGDVCYTPCLGGAVKCVTFCQSTGDTNIYVTPSTMANMSYNGQSCTAYVCGVASNSTTVIDACTWISDPTSPISPSVSPGTASVISVLCSPAGTAARSGVVCYTSSAGVTTCITVCQLCSPAAKAVNFSSISYNGGDGGYYSCSCQCACTSSAMVSGECFDLCLYADLCVPFTETAGSYARICIMCNATLIFCRCIDSATYCSIAQCCVNFKYGDCVRTITEACSETPACANTVASRICIFSINNIYGQNTGNFCKGTTCNCICRYTG